MQDALGGKEFVFLPSMRLEYERKSEFNQYFSYKSENPELSIEDFKEAIEFQIILGDRVVESYKIKKVLYPKYDFLPQK